MFKKWLQEVINSNDTDNGFTYFIRGNGRFVAGITNNIDVSFEMLEYQYKCLYYRFDTFTIGGWKNGQIYYLDYGIATDNLETALIIGKQNFQKSIWDNLEKKTIDIVY